MSKLIFTPHEYIIDKGKPLWPPREDPNANDVKAWELLDLLSDRQREIVEMRHYAEWTFKQIGAKLGISKQAAHSTHDRAMQLLRGTEPDETI